MWLVFTFLFVLILLLLAYLDTRKPKNYPPGPQWFPVIGTLWTLYKLRKETGSLCKATAKLAEKYGPVIGLRVGRDLSVIVYDCEGIRDFLSQDDLSGRPQGIFYKMRTWGKRRGLLLTDEDFWVEQRRFVLRHLRDFGFGRKNMSSLIEDEASTMIETLTKRIQEGKGSCQVQMDTFFGIHVLNTLWAMMAGNRYSPEDKQLKQLQSILTQLLANIDMVGALFSHLPFLRHIAPEFSGYNMYMKTHRNLWEFINKELQRHKASYNPNELRDLMDVYLAMLNSPERNDSFSEMQLLAICLDLFIAGSETTSKTLGFAFVYLLLYPEVQKKAQEEIDRVLGKKQPTLDDRPRMQYLECVVLESLRMFSGRAFSIPHRALKDIHLQGYFIPKDTMVLANFQGVLIGEKSGWSNPSVFQPDRFLQNGRIVIPNTYLPFGFGKRRCMGESLARANLFLVITTLLQHFDFSIPPNSAPPSTEYIDGVTPGPVPFRALVTPRN